VDETKDGVSPQAVDGTNQTSSGNATPTTTRGRGRRESGKKKAVYRPVSKPTDSNATTTVTTGGNTNSSNGTDETTATPTLTQNEAKTTSSPDATRENKASGSRGGRGGRGGRGVDKDVKASRRTASYLTNNKPGDVPESQQTSTTKTQAAPAQTTNTTTTATTAGTIGDVGSSTSTKDVKPIGTKRYSAKREQKASSKPPSDVTTPNTQQTTTPTDQPDGNPSLQGVNSAPAWARPAESNRQTMPTVVSVPKPQSKRYSAQTRATTATALNSAQLPSVPNTTAAAYPVRSDFSEHGAPQPVHGYSIYPPEAAMMGVPIMFQPGYPYPYPASA